MENSLFDKLVSNVIGSTKPESQSESQMTMDQNCPSDCTKVSEEKHLVDSSQNLEFSHELENDQETVVVPEKGENKNQEIHPNVEVPFQNIIGDQNLNSLHFTVESEKYYMDKCVEETMRKMKSHEKCIANISSIMMTNNKTDGVTLNDLHNMCQVKTQAFAEEDARKLCAMKLGSVREFWKSKLN